MQHQLPHLSPPGGYFAPRLAAVVAVAPLVAVAALLAVAALVVVLLFAMTLAAPSQSRRPVPSQA